MVAKKKPSAKQLAARAKFIKMVRAKSAAKKKAAPKKVAAKKVGSKKSGVMPKVFNPYMPNVDYSKRIKTAAKKALRKVSTHKDTKSHNVNIRVLSGVNTEAMQSLDYLIKQLSKSEKTRYLMKATKADKSTPYYKALIKYIAITKKQITLAKQAIK